MHVHAKGLATLVLAALATLACDPTYAVSVDNQSDQPVLIKRFFIVAGQPDSDVVIAGPHAPWTIGEFGVGSQAVLQWVVVMTATCDILETKTLGETFHEGGVIVVDPNLAITFAGGGNPTGGDAAAQSTDCG